MIRSEKFQSSFGNSYLMKNNHTIEDQNEKVLQYKAPEDNSQLKKNVDFSILSEEILLNPKRWGENIKDVERGLESLNILQKSGIPITKANLDAIYSILNDRAMSHYLIDLQNKLKTYDMNSSEYIPKIVDKLSVLLSVSSIEDVLNQMRDRNEMATLKILLESFLGEIKEFQLREPIIELVNRINGMQLLTQDFGHIHQIVAQFPFKIGEAYSDITMNVRSKKKRNGHVDSDYCHILFYLKLHELGNTIIDMKNQNRILNLTIYNQYQINDILQLLKSELKVNLEKHGYTLSTIKHLKPANENAVMNEILTVNSLITDQLTGVDIRI